MKGYVCNENQCCGCKLCQEICPKKCIEFKDDLKFQNMIIDETKCIHCNQCHKLCPQNTPVPFFRPIEWAQGWAKNDLRSNSSSGGFGSALIKYFDGVVCSCVFENGDFIFKIGESIEKYRGSKYVKSNPGGIYKQIKSHLKTKKVLFIGLPCQVAALKNYIHDDVNLYTVDLICHGTPSRAFLKDYLSSVHKDINSVNNIEFRKHNVFKIAIDGKDIVENRINDKYLHLFLNGTNYTENCYSCKFARLERVSDLTIGDSWGTSLEDEERKKGISIVLCQTNKGRELLNNSTLSLFPVDLDVAVKINHQLDHPSELPKEREEFFRAYEKKGFNYAFKKIYPKIHYKNLLKKLLIKLKLFH